MHYKNKEDSINRKPIKINNKLKKEEWVNYQVQDLKVV